MSAATVQPTLQDSAGDVDDLFHFGCVLQRKAARTFGTPVRCLCGAVQVAAKPGRGDGTDLRCVVCLDLAPHHLAACSACRARVAS